MLSIGQVRFAADRALYVCFLSLLYRLGRSFGRHLFHQAKCSDRAQRLAENHPAGGSYHPDQPDSFSCGPIDDRCRPRCVCFCYYTCVDMLALAGVVVIMLSGSIEISTKYLWGDLIILVSVFAWAYYTILGKPLVQKYGAIRMTAYSLTVGTVLYFPFGLYRAMAYDYSKATPAAWGSVLYLALGMSVIVYVLWYWVLKRMEASRLAVYHNIQPVVATIIAWLVLGEQITSAFVLGGAIVLTGLILAET